MGLAIILEDADFSAANLGQISFIGDLELVSIEITGTQDIVGSGQLSILYNPAFLPVDKQGVTWGLYVDSECAILLAPEIAEIDFDGNLTVYTEAGIIPQTVFVKAISTFDDTKSDILQVSISAIPPHEVLSYISSNNSQYIDTLLPITGDLTIEIDLSFNNPNEGSMMGAWPSANRFEIIMNSGLLLSMGGGGLSSKIQVNTTNRYKYLTTPSLSRILLDGEVLIDYVGTQPISSQKYFLFASSDSSSMRYKASIKMYFCKIWKAGELIRDFIPVLKDEVYCLFDRVSGIYYNNLGTGNFTGA